MSKLKKKRSFLICSRRKAKQFAQLSPLLLVVADSVVEVTKTGGVVPGWGVVDGPSVVVAFVVGVVVVVVGVVVVTVVVV